MPFFSIIVPVYNKINYLKRGLNCLLSQSFKDYEIILIDDGSCDGSSILCDQYAVQYPQIQLFHQLNAGGGQARNTGLVNAKGKFICFFDIDDTVGKNWLDIIYKNLCETLPEILVYGYREINVKYKTSNDYSFNNIELESNKEIGQKFIDYLSGIHFNNGFIWNKVYKKDFLLKNELKFPSTKIQHDELFNHQVYRYVHHIKFIEDILYNYYIYETGNIRANFIPERLEIFKHVKHSLKTLSEFWQIKDERLIEYNNHRFLNNVFFNKESKLLIKERKAYLQKSMTDEEVILTICEILRKKERLDFIFKIYCKLYLKKDINKLLIIETLLQRARKIKQKIKCH